MIKLAFAAVAVHFGRRFYYWVRRWPRPAFPPSPKSWEFYFLIALIILIAGAPL